jgi:DNA-binding MarR family transcriptional regulator
LRLQQDSCVADRHPSATELVTDEPGILAWRAFLTAHATIIRRLEAELEAKESLALSDLDVLIQLHRAGGTLRMRDLAERALLSRSGMTRRVDRLEAEGYIVRAACDTDRRGSFAHLTDSGRDRLLSALPAHLRGIDAHFIAKLSQPELESIRVALAKVLTDARPRG